MFLLGVLLSAPSATFNILIIICTNKLSTVQKVRGQTYYSAKGPRSIRQIINDFFSKQQQHNTKHTFFHYKWFFNISFVQMNWVQCNRSEVHQTNYKQNMFFGFKGEKPHTHSPHPTYLARPPLHPHKHAHPTPATRPPHAHTPVLTPATCPPHARIHARPTPISTPTPHPLARPRARMQYFLLFYDCYSFFSMLFLAPPLLTHIQLYRLLLHSSFYVKFFLLFYACNFLSHSCFSLFFS